MKKVVRIIINAGLLLSVSHYYIRHKKIKKKELQYIKKEKRLKGYYDLLVQWVYNLQNRNCLISYLKRNNISNVAIYGMGNVAEILINELKGTDIKILYGIDQNSEKYIKPFIDIPVIKLHEVVKQEKADAIIVTPIFIYKDILKDIRKQGIDDTVISLEDIVFNVKELEV